MHWVSVGLYSPPAVCTARPAASVDKPHCVSHIAGCCPTYRALRRFSYCRYKKTGSTTSKYIVSTVHRSHLITITTKAIATKSISYQPLWLCCWRRDISSFFVYKKNKTLLVTNMFTVTVRGSTLDVRM